MAGLEIKHVLAPALLVTVAIGVGIVFSILLINMASDDEDAGTVASPTYNGVEVLWLDVNGSQVPCAFYSYGSYGGAALSCDWEYGGD